MVTSSKQVCGLLVRNTRVALGKGAQNSLSSLQGLRVLVVEDGWQVAEALKLSLEKMGMVVAGPVATAGEAQCLAAGSCPDLAVVDLNLKGEMAHELMDRLHDRGIRIVVISGYEDLPRSLEKFAAILRKPFTVTTLLTTLRRVMERNPTP
jgi:DNA-binding response OmpR family regulator